jgi:serine/threonine protein kinase
MDLMLGCLEVDPEMRFNISNVRSHPWLAYPNAQQ